VQDNTRSNPVSGWITARPFNLTGLIQSCESERKSLQRRAGHAEEELQTGADRTALRVRPVSIREGERLQLAPAPEALNGARPRNQSPRGALCPLGRAKARSITGSSADQLINLPASQ